MEVVVVVCFILIIMFPFTAVYADYQGNVLYDFKKALQDPQNSLYSWNDVSSHCSWIHVSCDPNDQVIRVDLGKSGLEGPLVPSLGNLSTLQFLELYNNNITGSIPAELGNLAALVSLDLYGNSLNGSIPQELSKLKNLQFLRLHDNNLSGPIPDALANFLPTLNFFNVSGNPGLCGAATDKPCPTT